MNFTVTLTDEDVNKIILSLSELPLKEAYNLVQSLKSQCEAQVKVAQTTTTV